MILTRRLILITAALFTGTLHAALYELHDDILKTAENYVIAHSDQFSVTPEVKADGLDSRLRLSKCSKPLEAYESPNGLKAGRSIVGVKCTGDKPWKLYVPVKTALPGKVVVVKKPIRRGEIIEREDLALATMDLASIHREYFQNMDDIIGLKARRQLKRDQVVNPSALSRIQMVKRGSEVTILASSESIRIQMKGKAMANGAKGERIKVKNTSSGREVQAMVISPGIVKVVH